MPTPTSNRWNANINAIGRDSEGKLDGEEEYKPAIGRAVSPPKVDCKQGEMAGSDR